MSAIWKIYDITSNSYIKATYGFNGVSGTIYQNSNGTYSGFIEGNDKFVSLTNYDTFDACLFDCDNEIIMQRLS